MKISQLEQAVEVAKTKSISQAASNLYISQPNLSLSIRKLEEEIGTPIFKRTNSGVELTYFGTHFIENAREILLRMDLLEEYCSRQTKLQPLSLSVISGGYLFVNRRFSELFIKFLRGPIEFRYMEGNGPRQTQVLKSGQAELGFTSMWSFSKKATIRRMSSSGIEYHPLMDAVPGIYVDRTNTVFTEADTVVDLEKLKDLPYITTTTSRESVDVFFRTIYPDCSLEDIFAANHLIFTENSGAMRDFVRATGGFSLGTYCDSVYASEGFYESLRFIPFPHGILQCEVGWVQCDNTVRSPLADELIESLRAFVL